MFLPTFQGDSPQLAASAGSHLSLHLVTFEIAGHRFALPLDQVSEIVPAATITGLPGVPAAVKGVIDLRGALTPVIDLRPRLGVASRTVAVSDHFIVTRGGARPLILWVDRALGVAQVWPGATEEIAPELGGDPVTGIARLPEGLTLIRDVLGFLSAADAAELDRAIADAGSGAESR